MSYKAGIVAAITEIDPTGASSAAIKNHMQAKLAKDRRKWQNGSYLSTLKKMVAAGELVQTKGLYTLSAEYKEKVAALRTRPQKGARSKKLEASAVAANAELLANELAKYGLRRRSDSRLCDAFVNGTTDKTVEEVALVMCRMKYLHEGYCAKFKKQMRGIEEAIEAETEFIAKQYADPISGFEGYYRGITHDACREVTGEDSFGDYQRGVAESWKDFPAEWPWMKGSSASD